MLWLLPRNQKGPQCKIIVAREDFVMFAMENIQLHFMAISERKLTLLIQCNSEVSEERKDGELAACAFLNTGMEVISMCVVPVKLRHGDSGEIL